jgi:hypothetical protein
MIVSPQLHGAKDQITAAAERTDMFDRKLLLSRHSWPNYHSGGKETRDRLANFEQSRPSAQP